MTSHPLHTRIDAICVIQNSGTNAAALPILIQSLDDEDSLVAIMTQGMLRHLDVDPSAKIVFLTNVIRCFSKRGRLRAIDCFLWLDSATSEAGPVLAPMLIDPDDDVRFTTTTIGIWALSGELSLANQVEKYLNQNGYKIVA